MALHLKSFLLISISIILVAFSSCERDPQTIAMLVDTSGSMKKNEAMPSVKSLTIKKVKRYATGKNEILLYQFDTEPVLIYRGKPTKSTVSELTTKIESLDPTGKWTYLEKALLRAYEDISTTDAKIKKIIMFTDGLNDPPPGENPQKFAELVSKISKDLKGKGGLYIIDVSNKVPKREIIKEVVLNFLVLIVGALIFLIAVVVFIRWRKYRSTFPEVRLLLMDENEHELYSYDLNSYRKGSNKDIRISGDLNIEGILADSFAITTGYDAKITIKSINIPLEVGGRLVEIGDQCSIIPGTILMVAEKRMKLSFD